PLTALAKLSAAKNSCNNQAHNERAINQLRLTFLPFLSLAEWDPLDPECLLQVKELVQQYHQYQCSRLNESSRLMFEYQTLLEEPQYGENMEIYAGKKNNWTGEFSARFLLKLPVDFSNIPIYLLKDANEDPGEDVALLSVSFEDAEATQVFPKLYLSPRVEQ
ncbi:BRISC and BRCA1-A complex member 2-like, partial [Dendropsophus ebraccatus]|uniref:BRISC and BRCA1-A complex member 2-like n=1 Tax=Dendropsophus ebraccatus TaxID=150705 RepID=UPI003832090B